MVIHKDDVVIFNFPLGDRGFADLLRKKRRDGGLKRNVSKRKPSFQSREGQQFPSDFSLISVAGVLDTGDGKIWIFEMRNILKHIAFVVEAELCQFADVMLGVAVIDKRS